MTTISELREAIERYRKPVRNRDDYFDAIELIADCFTSRDTITRERLEELGGKQDAKYERRFVFNDRVRLSCFDDGECFCQMRINETTKWIQPSPQPQTMGDICRLLEQLTRE
jgi:hypothetical protein